MPFSLIRANNIANVIWSWCSIPRATLLKATYQQNSENSNVRGLELWPFKNIELHLVIKKLNLKEILCDDWETLSILCNSLQIWVLIQDIVIDVQEKLERVLVQEMYLKDKSLFFLPRILLFDSQWFVPTKLQYGS